MGGFMEYFKLLKKNLTISFLIFSAVPLIIAGGYFIYLFAKYHDAALIVGAILLIAVAVLSGIFAGTKLIERVNPIEDAAEKLSETLTEEEKTVLRNSSGGNPAKLIFNMVDYIAGRRIMAGNSMEQRKLFEAAAECTDEIIWRRDENGDTYYVPDIWRNRYPDISLKNGTPLESYIHPDDVEEFSSAMEIMNTKAGRRAGINIRIKTGEVYSNVGISARSSEIGGMICSVGAFVDTGKITEFETTIQEKYLMYHFALRAVSDVIYEVDVPSDTYSILTPDQWNTIFDIPLNGDFSFHRTTYAQLIHPDNVQAFKDRFGNYDHLLFMPDRTITYDYRVRRRNGDWIWVRHSVTSVKDDGTKVLKVIGQISDINERKRQEYRELYDRKHDSLTGAFLRSSLRTEFYNHINLPESKAYIMSVDIDEFSDVVEYYGHHAGDAVIRQVVQILWECQLGRCAVGRIESDDFVVIIKEPGEYNNPEIMFERISNAIINPINVENENIYITLSVGWSEYGKDGTEFDELLEKAEKARKRAHDLGRNRCVAYSEEVDA